MAKQVVSCHRASLVWPSFGRPVGKAFDICQRGLECLVPDAKWRAGPSTGRAGVEG